MRARVASVDVDEGQRPEGPSHSPCSCSRRTRARLPRARWSCSRVSAVGHRVAHRESRRRVHRRSVGLRRLARSCRSLTDEAVERVRRRSRPGRSQRPCRSLLRSSLRQFGCPGPCPSSSTYSHAVTASDARRRHARPSIRHHCVHGRQHHHATSERYGRNGSPNPSSTFGVGGGSMPYMRPNPARTPRSPIGHTSSRPSWNIKNICAVHSPMPRTRVSSRTTSSSGNRATRSSSTSPSSTLSARSRIDAALAPDSPHPGADRIGIASTAGTVGVPSNSAANRPWIAAAALPGELLVADHARRARRSGCGAGAPVGGRAAPWSRKRPSQHLVARASSSAPATHGVRDARHGAETTLAECVRGVCRFASTNGRHR